MTGKMSAHDARTAPEWSTHQALATAISGEVHPFDVYQGPYIKPPRGGRLWIVPHAGGASLTLYFEQFPGDPLGVTSRAVWGRSAENLPELAQVAQALIARYERNAARELRLSMIARFKEKQRP